jgi:hypothetical protein
LRHNDSLKTSQASKGSPNINLKTSQASKGSFIEFLKTSQASKWQPMVKPQNQPSF